MGFYPIGLDGGLVCLLRGGVIMEKQKRETKKDERKEYREPALKKHENLKQVTLLSFNPPTN